MKTIVRLAAHSLAALAAFASAAGGQAPTPLDSVVAARLAPAAPADSPGCAVAVVREGRVVLERAFGSADLERRVPVTVNTRFPGASITKQFTAMAVLLLAADGRLSLDDDVRRFVPEVPDLGATITLRHLLNHTSGLRDYWDLRGFAGRRTDDVVNAYDVLRFVSRQRALNFAPGEEYLYNNTGYVLLAVVVERAGGMPLPRFAEERIFRPLGMTATSLVSDHRTLVRDRALGYARGRNGQLLLAMPAYDVPQLVTTVGDLARWDRNFETGQVGGPAALERMRAPATLRDGTRTAYGAALQLGTWRGLRTEEHGGVDPGYIAQFLRFPDQRLTVIAMCTGRAVNPFDAAYAIADVALAREMAATPAPPAPPAPAAVAAAPGLLARYAGLYHGVSTDLVRRIFVRGDSLFYSRGPRNETHLAPLAPGRFLLSAGPARIEVEFTPVPGGARPEMWVRTAGSQPRRYVPVDSARGLPARLADYVGSYRSEELEAT